MGARLVGGLSAVAASAFVISFFAACGASSPAARSSSPPVVVEAADDGWASSTWEDRHDLMTWTVLPSMAKRFQTFRGEPSPSLTCRTCHGADAEVVRYALPNSLPALSRAHMPSRASTDPRTARMVAFMEDEVTPTVAKMLGLRVVSPTSNEARAAGAFSCFTCHPAAP